jgi:hypothetical protein
MYRRWYNEGGFMKKGISLIAVLMFMLAATTASIVIFRWISSEGFASGARLKRSEAYQASQAGLEAVQGWLANKGADAGALIKFFENNDGKPVLMVSQLNNGTVNLLGGMSKESQKFQVYFTGADVSKQPYQLKFMSIGMARDGSKYSQVGIFDVEGLYNLSVDRPPMPSTATEPPAFHGGLGQNTQGRFTDAHIMGDATLNGLSTTGDLIVTGNLTVMDNSYMYLGCMDCETCSKENSGNICNQYGCTDRDSKKHSTKRGGDVYILGSWNARGFTICGDAYIGGRLTTTSNTKFLGSLYANGGIENSGGFSVEGNVTLGGGNTNANTAKFEIGGNLVMNDNAKINIQDGSKITIGGSVWSSSGLFVGQNNNDKYNNIKLGATDKTLHINNATSCASATDKRNCTNYSFSWYQQTSSNYVHFTSPATYSAPTSANKITGANELTSMADKIEQGGSTKCPTTTVACVPDPLEVPADMKVQWLEKGRRLASLVISGDETGLPKSCVRLVKTPKEASAGNSSGYDSHWIFGDNVSDCNATDYPSAGMPNTCSGSSNNKYNFIRAANDCYAKLMQSDTRNILYQNGNSGEKFLALVIKNPEEKSPQNYDYLNGNFIFSYSDVESDANSKPQQTMKLPPTTDNSKVFLYFPHGSSKTLPLENSCLGLPSPCKRNYFIFSEKDFAGSTGSATINGAIFLANGSKITEKLPDATIEFNMEMYKALVAAGIVRQKGSSVPVIPENQDDFDDSFYIPSTAHLKVSLQNRYANEEGMEERAYAEPAILILPRVIYLRVLMYR